MLQELGVPGTEEPPEQVHSAGGQDPDGGLLPEARVQRFQEVGSFSLARKGDKLLELVDHEQDPPELPATQP
jgi:hypothetical protein